MTLLTSMRVAALGVWATALAFIELSSASTLAAPRLRVAPWSIVVPEAERLAGRVAPTTLAAASEALASYGFVVLRSEGGGSTPLVAVPPGAANAALVELNHLLARVAACGIDPRSESFSFTEIVHRARLRYDVQLDARRMPPDAPWAELGARVTDWAVPIFEAACGEAVECSIQGLITSLHGAPDQAFHRDGPHEAYYAYVSLVDTKHGPEFQCASHREGESAPAGLVRPALAAGDVLCYDYRVVHRGVHNPSHDRPIWYSGWAAVDSPAGGDGFNFGRRALRDLEDRQRLFPGIPQVPGQGISFHTRNG